MMLNKVGDKIVNIENKNVIVTTIIYKKRGFTYSLKFKILSARHYFIKLPTNKYIYKEKFIQHQQNASTKLRLQTQNGVEMKIGYLYTGINKLVKIVFQSGHVIHGIL
jgi:hypothetical protein